MIYTQIKEIYEILPLSSYYPLSTHVERISSSLITALVEKTQHFYLQNFIEM